MSENERSRVGCCGFGMARAAYYARFPLVEVQQTFYQPPRTATLERWRAEAPKGFEFTLKAWQLITHEPSSPTYRRLSEPVQPERRERYGAFRPTPEVFAAWERTLAYASALEARIILFQSPASFDPTRRHIDDLRAFFAEARKSAFPFTLAWEPRGWAADQAQALCDELSLVRVVDPFRDPPPERGLRYLRLHGIGGYRYHYSDLELARLSGWFRPGDWCLFNNSAMAEDAARFLERLERGGAAKP